MRRGFCSFAETLETRLHCRAAGFAFSSLMNSYDEMPGSVIRDPAFLTVVGIAAPGNKHMAILINCIGTRLLMVGVAQAVFPTIDLALLYKHDPLTLRVCPEVSASNSSQDTQ